MKVEVKWCFLNLLFLSVFDRSKLDIGHGVGEFANIEEPFGTEPRGVGPAETFPKGVVWCNDVPVASRVRDVYSAFRPIV